ncbi:MAG TPA: hypothetical protein VI981_02390 [Candidatus Paceibacterota bacterium]
MKKIVANLLVRNPYSAVRHCFTSKVDLPEFPKKHERVWLSVGNGLRQFRVVKRWDMQQGEDCVEFDFKRCLLVTSEFGIWLALEIDSRWKLFHRERYEKIIEERYLAFTRA